MSKRWSFRTLVVAGAFIVGMSSQAAFALTPTVTVTPNTNLLNKQVVTVKGVNFAKNVSPIYVVECNPKVTTQKQNACNLSGVVVTKSSATGVVGPVKFTVHTGTIGTGTGAAPCDHLHPCLITVSNASGTTHGIAKITFH
jgi:hypothetical protein